VFNTKTAAETYAVQVEAWLKLGQVDEVFKEPTPLPPKTMPTFKHAAERWMSVDGASFKAGTREDYNIVLTKHIFPTFETRSLDSITRNEIEDWWSVLRGKGLSPIRLSRIRTVLSSVFRRAVASGLLVQNPADAIGGRIGKARGEVRQVEWLTEPELTKLLRVAETREPRYYSMLLTLASTGLRLGEAVGLQVGDVDLERGKFHVRRAIRKRQEGSPKSGKPRTVDVPPSTIAALRGWIDTVRAEAALRGQEATWLFPSSTGRPLDEPLVGKTLRRILPLTGIHRRITPHSLRHTYASLALQRGVPLLVVSRQLGHSSISITADIYGHLLPDATREAATAWESILTEQKRNPDATGTIESTEHGATIGEPVNPQSARPEKIFPRRAGSFRAAPIPAAGPDRPSGGGPRGRRRLLPAPQAC
jgi:integrase